MADLTAVVTDPMIVPLDDIPSALGELERVRAMLWTRLTMRAPETTAAVPRYVTQAEAATTFGIPLATVRYLTRRGLVPAIGKGKNRRILPADLERHLARCAHEGLAIAVYLRYHDAMTGDEVRRVRRNLGMTQLQFAEAVGVARNTVARWERNELTIGSTAAILIRLLGERAPKRRGKGT
jgi:DNA-binding XRE family transcriptional regulator